MFVGWSRIACLAILALAGCDRVFGLERDPSCGDGELLLEEDCDDGNVEAGDGCGPTCAIEPGFECPATKDFCLPVLGLTRGPVDTQLEPAGAAGGSIDERFECPAGEVLIGFQGYADSVGGNLGRINALCGSMALEPDGDITVTSSSESGFLGTTQNSGGLLAASCDAGEIAVGFVPETDTYVSGFDWTCQAVSHIGGELRFGATRAVWFGVAGDVEEPARKCPPNAIVTEVSASLGSSVDLMGLGCSPLLVVVCGDDVVTASETCDDGNLERRDGCDAQCQSE
jgi:cysteine-rich repeat protein